VDIPTLDRRIAYGEIDNGIMLAAWCIFKSTALCESLTDQS
jgi:hypothetical protein